MPGRENQLIPSKQTNSSKRTSSSKPGSSKPGSSKPGSSKPGSSKPGSSKQGGARSAARLAAVQILYQIELEAKDLAIETAIAQFTQHRIGHIVDDAEYVSADVDFMADIAKGGWQRRQEWDNIILLFLGDGWTMNRLLRITRAIFRAAAYELTARIDVPRGAVINEYLDVAHAFHEKGEVSFINGLLDQLATRIRGAKKRS